MIVQTVIDVQKVVESTWGYIGLPYPEILVKRFLKSKKKPLPEYEFSMWWMADRAITGAPIRTKIGDEEGGFAEIFMPIWLFEHDNAPDQNRYLLPLTMMRMTCKKNIVTTPLVNRDGTVKEEISIDDWELDVKGVVIGLGNNYPDSDLQTLTD